MTDLASSLASAYSGLPQVEAVALSGSRAAGTSDERSDMDLYVYTRGDVPLTVRRQIAEAGGHDAEIDNRYWEPGDVWFDRATGLQVDVMFRDREWVEDRIDRVLTRHEASIGYTTCIWHNVLTCRILFDRSGWLARLRERADVPYPDVLRKAIVARNRPLLIGAHPSFLNQIALAIKRGDLVSVNHRSAAFVASYFDVLFAANRLPHPGEKRLLDTALQRCAHLPLNMQEDVRAFLRATAAPDQNLLDRARMLVDRLDEMLESAGLAPVPSP